MNIQNKTQIKAALRQSFGAFVYCINDMSDEIFVTQRSEGRWSPAEILGHLILSTKAVTKGMSMPKLILRKTFGKNNRKEMDEANIKTKYLRALKEKEIKAPPNVTYNGANEKGKEILISSFTTELDKMLRQIDKWNEKDLSEYVLPHPAIGKLTIREMLLFTHVHTGHHHEQLVKVEVS